MSQINYRRLALVLIACAGSTLSLSGCVTVKNYYQEWFGMDKSTREVTGYYQHLDTRVYRNTVVVPEGLDNPGTNPELVIPAVNAKELNGPLGEEMDVRPPTAPLRSDVGCHTEWSEGEAIIWFEANGSHDIHTEDDAWMLLASVLKHINVAVGKIVDGEYMLTTISRDFTEFGKPYENSDADLGLKRYNQIYQIRVGRNGNGEIGIATKLIGSMTMLSSGKGMKDTLDMIEQERFAMGFSNNIVHEIDLKNYQNEIDPDNLVITLGEDGNRHQAIMVDAPFETTNTLLQNLFDKCAWRITKHSVAKAEYEVEVLKNTDAWVVEHAKRYLDIKTGTYKLRVGIYKDQSSISFYDEKDNPLQNQDVTRLYPGFAEVMVEIYKDYVNASANVIQAK